MMTKTVIAAVTALFTVTGTAVGSDRDDARSYEPSSAGNVREVGQLHAPRQSFVRKSPIEMGMATTNLNAIAFRQNALMTVGEQQFAAYYNVGCKVTIARRTLGTDDWEIFNTDFVDFNSNATDDHNVITFGIDGSGVMHLCWGMHDHALIYTRSISPVIGHQRIEFEETQPMTGVQEEAVTYPQFYLTPNGDLLFMYRIGRSGNGDILMNRYLHEAGRWTPLHRPLFQGDVPHSGIESVNAYFNTLAFDSAGTLHATWTNRNTPGFQTNHNYYYAQSPDEGVHWYRRDGTAYDLPLSEANSEEIVTMPNGSSIMNQTSMAVDRDALPLFAGWWAPGAGLKNHTRQYMLAWYDGREWQTSQITNRARERRQGADTVRELGRPVVVVDDDNRTIVAMRFKERGNVLTVAYSDDRIDWQFVDLSDEDLGAYEPIIDQELWKRENKLHFFYQPVETGTRATQVAVLEWDAKAYFDQRDSQTAPRSASRSLQFNIAETSDVDVE